MIQDMLKTALPLFLIMGVGLSATNIERRQLPGSPRFPQRCGNALLSPPPFITSEDYTKHQASKSQPLPGVIVPTYVHVVSASTSVNLNEAIVIQQLVALNNGFASTGIQFDLRNFTTNINATWATANNTDVEIEMKIALRQGGYDSLNLYFLSDWNPMYKPLRGFNTSYGVCSYPETRPLTQGFLDYDGCIMNQYTMPGSPGIEKAPNNIGSVDEGKTAVHELGHWLYLIHVFGGEGEESDCVRDDEVFDTPLQAFASPITTRGQPCPPMVLPSCPGVTGSYIGPDNVDNFMDYSSDYCMNHFTAEQSFRMKSAWAAYRNGRVIGT
ncbi:hypothetical protein BT63DRAFT_469262 [Microthyrium microscopicum]|uniref:Peptidase M43 pregnancy-associated plasma-A domain-containing protein n=1 Tax=Microthyrium microscopicum TaxID=703497 RepID=A0A6A6UIZ7_9PEZI|nr:hypothetical protein BT63DRAFT_469262 [Microthyrium microscopicum]